MAVFGDRGGGAAAAAARHVDNDGENVMVGSCDDCDDDHSGADDAADPHLTPQKHICCAQTQSSTIHGSSRDTAR